MLEIVDDYKDGNWETSNFGQISGRFYSRNNGDNHIMSTHIDDLLINNDTHCIIIVNKHVYNIVKKYHCAVRCGSSLYRCIFVLEEHVSHSEEFWDANYSTTVIFYDILLVDVNKIKILSP